MKCIIDLMQLEGGSAPVHRSVLNSHPIKHSIKGHGQSSQIGSAPRGQVFSIRLILRYTTYFCWCAFPLHNQSKENRSTRRNSSHVLNKYFNKGLSKTCKVFAKKNHREKTGCLTFLRAVNYIL